MSWTEGSCPGLVSDVSFQRRFGFSAVVCIPLLPSSALVHLVFLPQTLPLRGSVVSILHSYNRLLGCVLCKVMLNSCSLNLPVHVYLSI